MPNPDGSGKRNAYFKSETAALKAIEQRNLKMKELTGRWSGKDLNAHYKDEIKFYGYEGTDWKKIRDIQDLVFCAVCPHADGSRADSCMANTPWTEHSGPV